MEEILKELAGLAGYIALILFGHAGLWSTLVSVVSGLIAVVVFVAVFLVCLPIARSRRLGEWPARLAKTVLGAQAIVMAWIITAVVGFVCQEKWGFSLVSTMIPCFILAFAGPKRDLNRSARRIYSLHEPDGVSRRTIPMMKSTKPGKSTSAVEVSNISAHGFWLFVADREHFVQFDTNPWFRNATVSQILNVQIHHGHHLHWPDLDVDLEVESLSDPRKYPLIYR